MPTRATYESGKCSRGILNCKWYRKSMGVTNTRREDKRCSARLIYCYCRGCFAMPALWCPRRFVRAVWWAAFCSRLYQSCAPFFTLASVVCWCMLSDTYLHHSRPYYNTKWKLPTLSTRQFHRFATIVCESLQEVLSITTCYKAIHI